MLKRIGPHHRVIRNSNDIHGNANQVIGFAYTASHQVRHLQGFTNVGVIHLGVERQGRIAGGHPEIGDH